MPVSVLAAVSAKSRVKLTVLFLFETLHPSLLTPPPPTFTSTSCLNTKPSLAVSVTVAVYFVLALKGESFGVQVMVPVYCSVAAIVLCGAAPFTGLVMSTFAVEMTRLNFAVSVVSPAGVKV